MPKVTIKDSGTYVTTKLEMQTGDDDHPYVIGRNGAYDIGALEVYGGADRVDIEGVSEKRRIIVHGGFFGLPTYGFTELCAAWLVAHGWSVTRPGGTPYTVKEE